MSRKEIEAQIISSDSYSVLKSVIAGMKGKTFHHSIHMLYDIRSLQDQKPKTYLEIGSYCGASACLMLQHPLPTNIICIDPLNLPWTHYGVEEKQEDVLRFNINKFNKYNRDVTIYKNFSTDSALHQKLKGEKADILFIDGDHAGNIVIKDFVNFHSMLNPGGFIIFDDYLDDEYSPQVKIAVDHICASIEAQNLPYDEIGLVSNYQNAEPADCGMLNEYILRRRQPIT